MSIFLQLICAFFGSLGFALYFNLKKDKVIIAAALGLLCWGIYLLMMKISNHIFIASLVATFVISILSEILARKIKAPSTVFYIIAIIPLVPGGTLYYMMDALVKSNQTMVNECAYKLIWTLIGMGVGAALVQGFVRAVKRVQKDRGTVLLSFRGHTHQDYDNDNDLRA